MSTSSLIYSRQISVPPAGTTPANFSGFRLDYQVTASNLLDTAPFVYQRNITGPGAQAFEDYFYTVASVADMAALSIDEPAEDEVFYRSSTAQLVFGSYEDALASATDIETALAELCIQNDASLALAPAQLMGYPYDSALRYWGVAASTTLTDEQLLAMDQEPATIRASTKTYDTVSTDLYLFMAFPATLGAATFTLDGTAEAMSLVTRSVTNKYGLAQSYRIYRTVSQHNGSDLVLAAS